MKLPKSFKLHNLGEYFYGLSMKRRRGKSEVLESIPAAKNGTPGIQHAEYKTEWFESRSEKVTTESFDGLKLAGYLFENDGSEKFAVACHGYKGSPIGVSAAAKEFYDRGFSVLIPAARAHECSEGDFTGMGWIERRDIIGWINYINERFSVPEIVLYGVSMGGATVMMTVGEKDLPENVRCAVEDCGYTSVYGEFRHTLNHILHLPGDIIIPLCLGTVRRHTGMNLVKDGNAIKQLKNCRIPMLFFHGDADGFVPVKMAYRAFGAHPGIDAEANPDKIGGLLKKLVIVKGATHSGCQVTAGEDYFKELFDFINMYI